MGAITAVPTVLILVITSNLSSAIIVFGIGVIIYFVATKRYWPFVAAGVLAVGAVVAFMLYIHYYVDPVTAGVGN